jgi:hypothetical protein
VSIIYDDGFMTEFLDSRIVAIAGRLRSGKTMLALQIAGKLLERGYKLVTNTSCVWADQLTFSENADELMKQVIWIDEGGLYIRSMISVSDLSSMAGKLDHYIIISGKRLPHEELCELTVTPWFDVRRNFMLPFYIWRWDVQGSHKDYHGFLVEGPRWANKGIYATEDPGQNAKFMVEYTNYCAATLFKKWKRVHQLSDVAQGRGELPDNWKAVDEMASAVQRFISVSGRKAGRGNR